jgi:hypothetical protein
MDMVLLEVLQVQLDSVKEVQRVSLDKVGQLQGLEEVEEEDKTKVQELLQLMIMEEQVRHQVTLEPLLL